MISQALAPTSIRVLPVELLTRIFRFAHDSEHCLAHKDFLYSSGGPHKWLKFPKQPDTLSHVCSSWRRIALATSSLWSHIDIAIDHNRNHNLLIRAKVYAERAGLHTLEIHICDPGLRHSEPNWQVGQDPLGDHRDLDEFKFLDASAVSIRSLIFDFYIPFNRFRHVHFSTLEYFVAKCTPGKLTKYIARVGFNGQNEVVETAENPHGSQINLLQLPKSQIEERWRSVSVLHVNGLCPRWSSKLYHGLVDLRLGDLIHNITEIEIVNILKASPGLQILHLKGRITLEIPEDTAVTCIPLNDLEVLNINNLGWRDSNGGILRWIQPGNKPLQLTYFGMPIPTVAEFLKRSNVTRLYSKGWEPSITVDFLCMIPQLQTLVLNVSDLEVDTIGALLDPSNENGSQLPAPPTSINAHIDTLYLFGFLGLDLDDIQETVNRYSVQRLFMWECRLVYHSDTGKRTDTETIRRKLSEISNCPVIEDLTNNLDPIDPDDWE